MKTKNYRFTEAYPESTNNLENVEPFTINIDQSTLDDLNRRIINTRWTDEVKNAKWKYGTNEAYLKGLCDYWQHDFNWKAQEKYLNSFQHYKTNIDGIGIHFIHQKGEGNNPIPLILSHGYPDSLADKSR